MLIDKVVQTTRLSANKTVARVEDEAQPIIQDVLTAAVQPSTAKVTASQGGSATAEVAGKKTQMHVAASLLPSAAATVAVSEAAQVKAGAVDTEYGIRQAVQAELRGLGVSWTVHFFLSPPALITLVRKLGLDPVEFYTARACWQGVDRKRRQVLGQVLSQYPALPAGQKTYQAAIAAARAQGREVRPTDEYFIRYFVENRKALKSLFRATLSHWFQSGRIECYRGHSCRRGQPDEEPVECYTLDPNLATGWTSDNVQRHRLHLNEIWSTFTVLQNNNRHEEEITAFSAGGKRRGKQVWDNLLEERRRYQETFQANAFT